MRIVPGEMKIPQIHQYLVGAVSPRPICFASTVDADGNANLSPYSFFTMVGSNPATLVFSSLRRMKDASSKDTLLNAQQTREVVINVVNYNMVQQASLSSCEYPGHVDEFVKAGFTKLASEMVKPFRVAESPVQMECRVKQIVETGSDGGAGNLIICEVLVMHISDEVLNEQQQIDPHKIDLVARMGADFYCRASGSAVFAVPKPNAELGIGFDALPESIRQSKILTGNQLGMLANVSAIPHADPAFADDTCKNIVQYYAANPEEMERECHRYAASLLNNGDVVRAWQVLLLNN